MYQPKKGAEKLVDAICNHRKQQLTMYIRKPLKARLRLLWLKLVVIARQIEYKVKK